MANRTDVLIQTMENSLNEVRSIRSFLNSYTRDVVALLKAIEDGSVSVKDNHYRRLRSQLPTNLWVDVDA